MDGSGVEQSERRRLRRLERKERVIVAWTFRFRLVVRERARSWEFRELGSVGRTVESGWLGGIEGRSSVLQIHW